MHQVKQGNTTYTFTNVRVRKDRVTGGIVVNSIESDTKIESVTPFQEELPIVVLDSETANVEIVGIQKVQAYLHRMKNHICTHIGTRCKNANAVNATHLLWCEFMCKCFKQCQLKDNGRLMCRYFTTLYMILSFNHALTKIIFKQSIYAC